MSCHFSSASGAYCTGDYAQRIMKQHNKYRAKHGAKDLQLDYKANPLFHQKLKRIPIQICTTFQITEEAQKYCDQMAKSDEFKHDDDKTYGENLFTGWGYEKKHEA